MFVGNYFVFCALSNLELTNAADTNKINIMFPGLIPDVPEKCNDLNFCTVKPDDYPQDLFNRMFEGKFKEPQFQPFYMMTANRAGDPDEMDDYETTVSFDPIYKVKTRQGDWRTVIQAPEENYLQMVRLESCKEVETPCFKDFKLPPGVQVICKQKYDPWEFLVHDGEYGSEKVEVDLPICCTC